MPSRFDGHTPGPWKVDARVKTRVESASGRGVATTGGYFTTEHDTTDENEANAHLIAAAPDLLRQRDELAEAIRVYLRKENTTDDADYQLAATEELAEALTKIEGEG